MNLEEDRGAVFAAPAPQKTKAPSAANHNATSKRPPALKHWGPYELLGCIRECDRELEKQGFIRDGYEMIDNRDHFFHDYPEDIRQYDPRTSIVVSHSLFWKLVEAFARDAERGSA